MLWAYSISHSSLLLRGAASGEEQDSSMFDIDIEFGGVGYLDLPIFLIGLKIRAVTEVTPDKWSKFRNSMGFTTFEIISDHTYHVIAANCTVGTHRWLNGDRLTDPTLEYDQILASYWQQP